MISYKRRRLKIYVEWALIFMVLFIVVLLAARAQAEPFLWCGATPDATKWEITLDGVLIETITSHIADETAWLKYDLIGLSDGQHKVEVRAGNVWGWSEWYPLYFSKATADVLISPYIDI